jgi:cysteine desulfurase
MLDEWTFDKNGVLIPSFGQGVFEMAIEGGDILSVAAANSETGILTNVSNFAASSFKAHRHLKPLATHRLFVDATQALGKAPFSFHDSKADFAICSAHKLGGPKGIGALVMRRGIDLDPLVRGGGQEMGRRAGTENVIGIAGFGAAAEAAARDVAMGRWEEVAEKRDFLETSIAATANKTIFVGNGAPRLPNTSCFAVPGWKGETQVMQMDLAGFAISAGSACSSGKVKQSRVLTAMGYDKVTAGSAIRVSLGLETTTDDVARFADAWSAAYRKFCAKVA